MFLFYFFDKNYCYYYFFLFFLGGGVSSTPVEFMRRVLGVEHVGESFDFSAALVDLVPTVPTVPIDT